MLAALLRHLLVTKPRLSGASVSSYIGAARSHLSVVYDFDFRRGPLLSQTLHRLKQVPVAKHHRVPCTPELIRLVVSDASLPLALRAAVALAWSLLLRASEYLSDGTGSFAQAATLLGRHVTVDPTTGGFRLFVPASKGDVFNSGTTHHLVPVSDELCPVRLLRMFLAHRQAQGIAVDKPLFTLDDRRYLTRDHVSAALKAKAPLVGLPVDRTSSHGIRIGGAFCLANRGVPFAQIQQMGRWKGRNMAILYAQMSVSRRTVAAEALRLSDPRADPPLLAA